MINLLEATKHKSPEDVARKRLKLIRLPLAGLLFLATLAAHAQPVKQEVWGTTDKGVPVNLFTLEDKQLRVQLTEFGARIVSIDAPDRNGTRADVVLGFNSAAQYLANPKSVFGAIPGRYANRIAKGTFTLNGTTYHIPINNNGNAIHGGPENFTSKIWHGKPVGQSAVEFTLLSPDQDMGFPGALTVHIRYTLTGAALRIDYSATTTKPTVLNLTNHTFFNLAGEASGDILNQQLQLAASHFTPTDPTSIPTGEITPVDGTPFDFRALTPIGQRIADPQLRQTSGYDHNLVLDGYSGKLRQIAYALDPTSGRSLTVLTTEPAVQLYSGNNLNGTLKGYSGTLYQKHAGFCLETQHYPDAPNHPTFPTTTLLPGKTFHSTTIFQFGTAKNP